MQRFFISPSAFVRPIVTLIGEQAHQVRRVLRLRPGDRVVLLDGRGGACEAALIAADEAGARFQVLHRWEAEGEPAIHITLFQAMLKGERFGWALQKGTEIGVSAFVPLICERSVVDDLSAIEHKRERWQRIIQEAAEQSGRGRLPVLHPAQAFPQALGLHLPSPLRKEAGGKANVSPGLPPLPEREDKAAMRLILWEGEREIRLRDALDRCNLAAGAHIQVFVGPEGGFSASEIALARDSGICPVSLGPRILRAETAGIVAAALILYAAHEM
ncbi:MAG: RsmE family RNA methyltransferase [Anaerolineae bacterium]